MNRFQVVVVGGGPAGATAACELASSGHSVLLLEREVIPRYKACGGGLGPKSIKRLPFPISEIPHVQLQRIAFRLRGRSPVTWSLPNDFPFYMVMRTDLDARLVQAAQESGAVARSGEMVRYVRPLGEGFLVETDCAQYQADFLLGADGAKSTVRRSLGIEMRRESAVALECEIEVPERVYRVHAGTALFDVDAVPHGYGWVFPKVSHLSVGIGTMMPASRPLRALLHEFILRYQLVPANEIDSLAVHFHPLPLATTGEPARSGNAVLCGDAAGVVDGFAGEGICYAMASGELAATAASRALNGDPSGIASYEADLDRLIRHDHGRANRMGQITRRFPDGAYFVLTSMGEGRSVIIPLLLGEIGFGECLRRLPRLLLLERSGHRTTEPVSR